MRNDPAFQALLAQAEAGRRDALAAFREAGGERLLGGERPRMNGGGMKTLARHRDKAEILRAVEIGAAGEPSRRWGRMSAHQMVCHLSDSFRMAVRREAGERRPGRTSTDDRQVDRAVPSLAVAGGNPHHAGTRSGTGRDEAHRFRRRRRRARGAVGSFITGRKRRRPIASDFRQDVGGRLAALGLPPHGPPPSAVRVVVPFVFCGCILKSWRPDGSVRLWPRRHEITKKNAFVEEVFFFFVSSCFCGCI